MIHLLVLQDQSLYSDSNSNHLSFLEEVDYNHELRFLPEMYYTPLIEPTSILISLAKLLNLSQRNFFYLLYHSLILMYTLPFIPDIFIIFLASSSEPPVQIYFPISVISYLSSSNFDPNSSSFVTISKYSFPK